MGVTKRSAALRIPLGLGLVGFALAAGLVQRSPWILPFLGAGVATASALARSAPRLHGPYAATFLGSAAGCLTPL